jgi:hypothetical protein
LGTTLFEHSISSSARVDGVITQHLKCVRQ